MRTTIPSMPPMCIPRYPRCPPAQRAFPSPGHSRRALTPPPSPPCVGDVPDDPFMRYGTATALTVGMVHAVGAETPTQVVLFLSAVGAGGRTAGTILLITFLVGLFVSNTLIAIAGTFGFLRASRKLPAVRNRGRGDRGSQPAPGGCVLVGEGAGPTHPRRLALGQTACRIRPNPFSENTRRCEQLLPVGWLRPGPFRGAASLP
jgi:hypothetical protein